MRLNATYFAAIIHFSLVVSQQPNRLSPMGHQNAQAGAYSPAVLSAALNASQNTTGRTVYVGNLPATASVDEPPNLVHFGPLESVRVLPEKSCVFLSFLDGIDSRCFPRRLEPQKAKPSRTGAQDWVGKAKSRSWCCCRCDSTEWCKPERLHRRIGGHDRGNVEGRP